MSKYAHTLELAIQSMIQGEHASIAKLRLEEEETEEEASTITTTTKVYDEYLELLAIALKEMVCIRSHHPSTSTFHIRDIVNTVQKTYFNNMNEQQANKVDLTWIYFLKSSCISGPTNRHHCMTAAISRYALNTNNCYSTTYATKETLDTILRCLIRIHLAPHREKALWKKITATKIHRPPSNKKDDTNNSNNEPTTTKQLDDLSLDILVEMEGQKEHYIIKADNLDALASTASPSLAILQSPYPDDLVIVERIQDQMDDGTDVSEDEMTYRDGDDDEQRPQRIPAEDETATIFSALFDMDCIHKVCQGYDLEFTNEISIDDTIGRIHSRRRISFDSKAESELDK
ncbi:hypothetical protein BDA99DRAFT_555612 [Phascolomyces articulosus]|uniref:Uncharacterized protein n=1 Tax=Phascolomyces articulosus TaxID=60185 RepID=A0AAD5KMB3_9FUNG|nr:hypothetical protein BDA99DRAFT_555612 [Phascolomyces articulosus]